MERSEREPVLDPEVVRFVQGGVLAGVVTRSDDLRPEFARGWGVEVATDGLLLRVCVPAPDGSRMLANLKANGAVAVGFSPPTIARAAQVKGSATELGEPTATDLERVDRHFNLFVRECERIGARPGVPPRMLVRAGFVAVGISIDEVFDQTPGPTAGRRL